jgi:hypothetical protein
MIFGGVTMPRTVPFWMYMLVGLLLLGLAVAMVQKWETAAANTLHCGVKGVEIVERPSSDGSATTAKFIVCKK